MTQITREQADWMGHSNTLLRARINQTNGADDHALDRFGLDRRTLRWMKWEYAQRAGVMEQLANRMLMTPTMEVVFAYMVEHADLQIARYGRQIDDATFLDRCYAARERMYASLRALQPAA